MLIGTTVWVLEAARLADDVLYNCLKEIYAIRHAWLYAFSNLIGVSWFAPASRRPPSSTGLMLLGPLQSLPGTLQELIRYRNVGVNLSTVILHSLLDCCVIHRALVLLGVFGWGWLGLSTFSRFRKGTPHLQQEETRGKGEPKPSELEPTEF